MITDGATDKSVKEQEIVYYRSSNGGLVDSFYIGIGEPERADANGIISVIDSDFGSLDIKDYRHNWLVSDQMELRLIQERKTES